MPNLKTRNSDTESSENRMYHSRPDSHNPGNCKLAFRKATGWRALSACTASAHLPKAPLMWEFPKSRASFEGSPILLVYLRVPFNEAAACSGNILLACWVNLVLTGSEKLSRFKPAWQDTTSNHSSGTSIPTSLPKLAKLSVKT